MSGFFLLIGWCVGWYGGKGLLRKGLTKEEDTEPHFLYDTGDFSNGVLGLPGHEDDGFGAGVCVGCVDDGGEDTEKTSTWSSLCISS